MFARLENHCAALEWSAFSTAGIAMKQWAGIAMKQCPSLLFQSVITSFITVSDFSVFLVHDLRKLNANEAFLGEQPDAPLARPCPLCRHCPRHANN